MADNIIPITAGSGTSVRTVTNAGVDSGAHQQVVSIGDSAGNLLGTTAAPFPVSSVADLATSGTMAATSATVALATGGRGTTAIEITGTWVGTITFQATSDPSGIAATTANWYSVNAPAPTVTVAGSTTTVNGLFRINSSGYTAVRVIMTAYTSGTATAWMNAAAQASMVTLAEPVTIGADPDTVATGTITATDAVVAAPTGNGALLSGTPTASSFVMLACPGGDSSWDIQLSGTFGSGTVYFEASFDGGTNYLPVNGRQTGIVNTALGYSTTTAGAFRGNTSGASNIRARIVGATAPSVAVTLRISSGVGAMFLNASIPAGTNTIGTTATANSSLTPSGSPYSLSAANATADGVTDVSIYSSARVQITGTWSGTATFQVSLDGTNWSSRTMNQSSSNAWLSSTTVTGLYFADIGARYFRVNITGYTSGTFVIGIQYSTAPSATPTNVIANITSSMTPGTSATNMGKAQGNTPGTTDTGVAPVYIRAPTTPVARTATAGNYSLGMVDAEGKQIVQQYADPANTWQSALTLTTTTSTAASAAQAAGIRNYVTGLTLSNSAATATLVQVLDGSTVLWQAQLAASQAAFFVAFETPLRGTAATAMNVKLGTAVTSVYASLQGFIGV